MSERLLLIPLDDRPATARYPVRLGAVAGCEVLVPPGDLLGSLTRPAACGPLMQWLVREAGGADGIVLALDTLAYGGLIPSRLSREPLQTIVGRLTPLWALKEAHPGLSLAAFGTIPRLSETAAIEEEAPYWPQYASQFLHYSRCAHQARLEPAETHRQALAAAAAAIPPEILTDYLAWRQRNQDVNRLMVEWAAAGLFDHFCLTSDDSADRGLNVMEKEDLQALITIRGVTDKVLLYPGADEVGGALVARTLLGRAGFRPQFFPIYAHPDHDDVVTLYEGLPLRDTVALQVAAVGATLAEYPEQADCQLFVHNPEQEGGDFWLGLGLPDRPETFPETLVRDIGTALQLDSPVAVADVAWANAAHPQFVQRLLDQTEVTKLLGYAGWNTAGNTLGTVLAHAALRLLALEQGGDLEAQELAHQRFLFERFAEDWLYMAIERPAAVARGGSPDLAEVGRLMATRAEAVYTRYWKGNALCRVAADGAPHYWRLGDYRRTEPGFPWGRLFDIDITADFSLEEVP